MTAEQDIALVICTWHVQQSVPSLNLWSPVRYEADRGTEVSIDTGPRWEEAGRSEDN